LGKENSSLNFMSILKRNAHSFDTKNWSIGKN